LTIVCDELEGITQISVQLGDIEIPFSAEKDSNDPDKFMNDLGILKPEEGYNSEIVNFTGKGEVIVISRYLKKETLVEGAGKEVDLPEGYITGTKIVTVQHSDWLIWVVIGSVIGLVLLAVLVITIYCIKKKKRRVNEQSSSLEFSIYRELDDED
jgi:type IV secretory pathway TrbD component